MEFGMVSLSKKRPISKVEQEWLENNKKAIEAYNERVDKHGPLLIPHWAVEEK